VLGEHLPGYLRQEQERLCGWSVGAVVGNETLVQSRPIVRGSDPVDDLLRTSAGCTIAAFATQGRDEPATDTGAAVRLARYRRWVGVRGSGALRPELCNALRAELPDFLARGSARTETELLFLRFLTYLRESGGLGAPFSPPQLVRQALRALGERVGDGPLNLLVTDGRTLGIIHRGGTLLAFEPPPDVRPSRRFRVVDGEPTAPAHLFMWKEGPPPSAPVGGAERIAEGILTVRATKPSLLERE
jgi:hypothetical protein